MQYKPAILTDFAETNCTLVTMDTAITTLTIIY